MGEVTDGFVPSPSLDAEGDLPGFNELLGEQNFVERLESARIRRAKVLAEQAQDAEDKSGFLKTTKPWEKPKPQARRLQRPAPRLQLKLAAHRVTPPLVLANSMRRAVVKRPLVLVSPRQPTVVATSETSRLSLGKAGGGFALGLLAGAGVIAVATWIAGSRGNLPPTEITAAPFRPEQRLATVSATAQSLPESASKMLRQYGFFEPAKLPSLSSGIADVALPNAPMIETWPITGRPAAMASVAAADPLPISVAMAKVNPHVGVTGDFYAQGLVFDPVERALPVPGVITKITTVSAPAVLVANTSRKEPEVAASVLPPSPPNTAVFLPKLATPDQTRMVTFAGMAQGADPRLPPPLGAPQLVQVSLGADLLLSGTALETSPPNSVTTVAPNLSFGIMDVDAISIRLHAHQSLPESEIRAVAETLASGGFAVEEPVLVSFTINTNQVRFFHPGDAEAAHVLANEIGATARDFTKYKPSPPVGTMEIWLAGIKTPKTAATQRKKPRSSQPALSEDAQIRALRDRLILQLQTGQHL